MASRWRPSLEREVGGLTSNQQHNRCPRVLGSFTRTPALEILLADVFTSRSWTPRVGRLRA